MSVGFGIIFLVGAIGGALLMLGVHMLAEHRARRPHDRDPHYAAARFAAVTHIRRHGRVTRVFLKELLELNDRTTDRYLEQIEREGLIRRHAREHAVFYTRS